MQSFELCENWQPKEIEDRSGFKSDNNMGLPLDLLKEGQNFRVDEHVQPASEYKAGYPSLPEMSLYDLKAGDPLEDYDFNLEKEGWSDVYKWGKRLFQELKDAGLEIGRRLENIKPQDLLELAKDLAVVAAKFGPVIGADIARVIKSKGMDPVADAKLVIDLVEFARSPEAAKVGEDVMKILRDFQRKFGITQ